MRINNIIPLFYIFILFNCLNVSSASIKPNIIEIDKLKKKYGNQVSPLIIELWDQSFEIEKNKKYIEKWDNQIKRWKKITKSKVPFVFTGDYKYLGYIVDINQGYFDENIMKDPVLSNIVSELYIEEIEESIINGDMNLNILFEDEWVWRYLNPNLKLILHKELEKKIDNYNDYNTWRLWGIHLDYDEKNYNDVIGNIRNWKAESNNEIYDLELTVLLIKALLKINKLTDAKNELDYLRKYYPNAVPYDTAAYLAISNNKIYEYEMYKKLEEQFN